MRASSVRIFRTDKALITDSNAAFPSKWLSVHQQLALDQRLASVMVDAPRASMSDVRLTHCPQYAAHFVRGRLSAEQTRRIGLGWSEQVVERVLTTTGGTVAASRFVIDGQERRGAAVIGGGAHHAFRDYGSGYCVFNDTAVASNVVRRRHPGCRIVHVDLDVHQGDGTAALLHADPNTFTCSIHCASNFPWTKQTSSIDIELQDGTDDQRYHSALASLLAQIDAKFPDASLLFYQAGVDVLQIDRLGKLALSADGVAIRDDMVYQWARRKRINVVAVMGGGYFNRRSQSVYDGVVAAHVGVVKGLVNSF